MNLLQIACATCGTDPTHQVTQAANGAIIFMLLILLPILGGFIAFIRYLAKCEKQAIKIESEIDSDRR